MRDGIDRSFCETARQPGQYDDSLRIAVRIHQSLELNRPHHASAQCRRGERRVSTAKALGHRISIVLWIFRSQVEIHNIRKIFRNSRA